MGGLNSPDVHLSSGKQVEHHAVQGNIVGLSDPRLQPARSGERPHLQRGLASTVSIGNELNYHKLSRRKGCGPKCIFPDV